MKGLPSFLRDGNEAHLGIDLCGGDPSKPYSDEDYEDAKSQGLDLDNWNDYKRYCRMEEYADEEERY
ncbi:hypothetical protein D3C74_415970 [compost metagenome]